MQIEELKKDKKTLEDQINSLIRNFVDKYPSINSVELKVAKLPRYGLASDMIISLQVEL